MIDRAFDPDECLGTYLHEIIGLRSDSSPTIVAQGDALGHQCDTHLTDCEP